LVSCFDAVQLGHRDIHEDNVRFQLLDHAYRFPSVYRVADDADIPLNLEQKTQSITNDSVIVCQQNLNRHGLLLISDSNSYVTADDGIDMQTCARNLGALPA